jgi:hypothetical protein
MRIVFDWIRGNPSSFASMIAAVIAASVALIVFALTQLLTSRRERKQFLTPKLEQLYLLLNRIADGNVNSFKRVYVALHGSESARERLLTVDERELYDYQTSKEMIMYTRLYFPKLSRVHQLLFGAQSALHDAIFRINSDSPPEYPYVEGAFGRVAHFIRLMEVEIIRNRDRLIGDYFFFRRYKGATEDEIEAENPAPPGPAMKFWKGGVE